MDTTDEAADATSGELDPLDSLSGDPAVVPIEEAVAVEAAPDVEATSDVLALIYTGPSAVFIFDGVRFVPGIPTQGSAALIERLRDHPLAADGHRLTIAE